MKFEKNELRVAIFILIPITILLFFFVLKLGYSFASSTIDVYMKVDNISAIKKGTQVQIRGYTIGRIIEINPVYQPALHFLAVMRIKNDITLSENCSAIIQNQNIIGDTVIELSNPETIGNPLQDGAVIEGIERVNLEVLLQNINNLVTSISSTVNVIKGISSQSKGNLKNLIANLSTSASTLSDMLSSSQKDIVATISTFRETAKTMKEISVELKKHPVKFLFKGKD